MTDGRATGHGYAKDKNALVKRLHRIEGQVRGIERMVEDDRYCIDILTQISAVTTALESLAVRILDEHVRHCVAGALASGDRRTGGEERGAAPSGPALRRTPTDAGRQPSRTRAASSTSAASTHRRRRRTVLAAAPGRP